MLAVFSLRVVIRTVILFTFVLVVQIIYYPFCAGNFAGKEKGKHDIADTAGEPDGKEQKQEDKGEEGNPGGYPEGGEIE